MDVVGMAVVHDVFCILGQLILLHKVCRLLSFVDDANEKQLSNDSVVRIVVACRRSFHQYAAQVESKGLYTNIHHSAGLASAHLAANEYSL